MTLHDRIAAAAGEPTGLRFDEFMERVLYDPLDGFYASVAPRADRAGDFLTAPSTSPLFGQCVAQALAGHMQERSDATYAIVEIGAGDGRLAERILKTFAKERASPGCVFHLVERSAAARELLTRRLADPIRAGRVIVHEGIETVPGRIERGALVANELFDNLPVRRVMQADQLMEIRVRYHRARFEELLTPAPTELIDYFAAQNVVLRAGQSAEVCLAGPRLLSEVATRFEEGRVLIFDYGQHARILYAHERFPNGTLACHRRHGTDRAFYDDLGTKDITAHVNLSALAEVLFSAGWQVEPLVAQADFLLANGAAQALGDLSVANDLAGMQRLLRAKQLVHPAAMGEAFHVLTATKAT